MRLVLLCSAIAAQVFAQQAFERFQRFDVEDGLSQGTISEILQDHQGYIWIGTHDGLNRFDGVEFKVFRHRVGVKIQTWMHNTNTSLPPEFVEQTFRVRCVQ